jgi:hypothetical protein
LAKQKAAFLEKPEPKWYQADHKTWEAEKKSFADKEADLASRLSSLDAEMEAIRTRIKKAPPSLTPSTSETQTIERIRYTAKEIQSIIKLQLDNIRLELAAVNKDLEKINPKRDIISEPRALLMAKAKYTHNEEQLLTAMKKEIDQESVRLIKAKEEYETERAKLPAEAPKWYFDKQIVAAYNAQKQKVDTLLSVLTSRERANAEKLASYTSRSAALSAKLSSPLAKAEIEKIKNNILAKNAPIAKRYETLIARRKALTTSKSKLEATKKSIVLQVGYDSLRAKSSHKPERTYSVKASGGAGAGSSSASGKAHNPAAIIAAAFNGDAKAVPLVISIEDHEEYDFAAMTPDQIQTAMAKIRMEQSM